MKKFMQTDLKAESKYISRKTQITKPKWEEIEKKIIL